ncbi:MAG: LLM class flavin-dependent oxidoreductase [Proteobacteria bacterium]|nr:LLM class flavin-dependent oxidoreductase [Pseudomonadota bacterium]
MRLYPHARPVPELLDELRAQAALADRSGFDGVMLAEHHGGFPGYLPNPVQACSWLLDAMPGAWAAACPLLLPLRHWTQVAEELAWLAGRFPGRVGAGLAVGGLERDFEIVELDYAERRERFREALPRLVAALRGESPGAVEGDPALAACAQAPIPLACAAQGPKTAARAAELGLGLLYDSLQPAERLREVSEAYAAAGGRGVRIGIRRAWLGDAPRTRVDRQMDFYRGYASRQAQRHWGEDELVGAGTGDELAERLARFARESGCDALNLRVHFGGIEPGAVREQVERLGAEMLPALRERLAGPA